MGTAHGITRLLKMMIRARFIENDIISFPTNYRLLCKQIPLQWKDTFFQLTIIY